MFLREFSKEEIRIVARECLLYACQGFRSPSEALFNIRFVPKWTRGIWFAGDGIKRIILRKMGIKYHPSYPWYYGMINKVYTNSNSRMAWRDYIIEFSLLYFTRNDKIIISYSENYLLLVIENTLSIYYQSLENKIYSMKSVESGYYPDNYYRPVEREDGLLICKTDSYKNIFYFLDSARNLKQLFIEVKHDVLLCLTHGYVYNEKEVNLFQKYEGGGPYIFNLFDVSLILLEG